MSRKHPSVIASTFASCLIAATLACCQPAWAREKPFNRVVLGIDTSGSYLHRQAEALDKAKGLLEALSKRQVKRWEKADEVVIIAIDSLPEVIWSGDARSLAALSPEHWQARIAGRRDLARCTDIARFFQLAARQLNEGARPEGRYLFVFSDLIADPPKDDGTQCQAVIPAAELTRIIPWQSLEGTVTEVYWMPAAQKLAWSRAAERLAPGLRIRFHSESESAAALAEPPVKAQRPRPQRDRGAFLTMLTNLALWSLGLFVLAVGAIQARARWLARPGRPASSGQSAQ